MDIDVEMFSFVVDIAKYNFAITVEGNSICFEVSLLNNEFCYLHGRLMVGSFFGVSFAFLKMKPMLIDPSPSNALRYVTAPMDFVEASEKTQISLRFAFERELSV